jgi:hypothetical protein
LNNFGGDLIRTLIILFFSGIFALSAWLAAKYSKPNSKKSYYIKSTTNKLNTFYGFQYFFIIADSAQLEAF